MMALNRYRLKALSAKNNTQAKRVEKLLKKIDYLIGKESGQKNIRGGHNIIEYSQSFQIEFFFPWFLYIMD